ncbi:hypothetical protein [Rhodobacter ferrooxidans]|nr:hypothetical protein [Rhodobacter sp. SW2]
MKRLEPVDFRSLQTLAMWVYDNNSDAETRRSLVAAEIARSAFPDEEPARIAALAPNFLEGARIAHQVGLNKVSLDTLRALADLRKTVSDETARFSEATRQLSTSVAGAVFTGIGVMAARLSLPVEGTAFSVAVFVVGVVLLLYVWAVIWNGYRFMAIQKQLRLDWRQRLYRYLQKEEYDLLVTSPAESAERAYTWAARFAIAIAVFLLLGLSVVAFSDAFSAALRGEAMTDLPVTGTSAAP